MDIDPTATFASSNWITKPQPLEPFNQLGGVLPNKQLNSEFLDYTNTWLITTNVDYRPQDQKLDTAYSVNRPSYLRRPGELPSRCQMANDALIRDQIANWKIREPPFMPSDSSSAPASMGTAAAPVPAATVPAPAIPKPVPLAQFADLPMAAPAVATRNGMDPNVSLLLGLVAIVLLVVLLAKK